MTSSLKAPWVFQGRKVDWVTLIASNENFPSVSLVTHHEKVKVAIMNDSGSFPESKRLLDAIVAEMTAG